MHLGYPLKHHTTRYIAPKLQTHSWSHRRNLSVRYLSKLSLSPVLRLRCRKRNFVPLNPRTWKALFPRRTLHRPNCHRLIPHHSSLSLVPLSPRYQRGIPWHRYSCQSTALSLNSLLKREIITVLCLHHNLTM